MFIFALNAMKKVFVLSLLIFPLRISYSQVQLVASNVGNNFTLIYPGNLGSPATVPSGLMITFKSTTTITGPATLNVNGSGAKSIKKQVSTDLSTGDILSGQFVTVIYDGTNYQLLSSIFSTNGTSWLLGGNSVSGSNTLGTLNNMDLVMVTNNLERMRISSSTGYVGIGTTAPSMPFHVQNNFSYTQGQSGFSGSAFVENTYLSVQTSIGIGLYVKSNATQFGVGSVFESGQLGVYALSQSTGTGSRTGLQGIASGGDSGYGLRATGSGNQYSYGVFSNANSNSSAISYGISSNANAVNGDSYGINSDSYTQNGSAYGIKSYSRSDNGVNSYGTYTENYNYSSTGTAYGSYIYNTGYASAYGMFITNYGSAGYSSIGLYSSAYGGTSNYSGYFAGGDVFVNDRVTIGFTTPKTLLSVQSSGANWDLINTNGDFYLGDNNYSLRFGIATGGGGAGDTYISSQGGTNRIAIGTGSNVGTLSLTNNQVTMGIFPNYATEPTLHVYNAGGTGMVEVMRLSGGDCSGNNGPMLNFQNKCSGFTPTNYQDWITASIGSPYSGTGAYRGDLTFYTNNGLVTSGQITSLERMRINSQGLVGIGTPTPNALLDVYNGSISVGTGNIGSSSAGLVVGYNSTVSGAYSIAAGYISLAGGVYCGAFGYQAKITGNGSFVFCGNPQTVNANGSVVLADYSSTNLNVSTGNKFYGVFGNGYALYTNSGATIGVQVAANGTSWASISDSAKKENFVSINFDSLLYKIDKLSLKTWNYKFHDKSLRHYGPVAQEFYYYFGKDKLGFIGNDTTISTQDIEGLTLTAVQALVRKNKDLSLEVSNLKLESEKNHSQINLINQENILLRNEIAEIKRHLKLDAKVAK